MYETRVFNYQSVDRTELKLMCLITRVWTEQNSILN